MKHVLIAGALLLFVVGSPLSAADRFRVLHNFAGGESDGRYPSGPLTLAGSTLFGTTALGGADNLGAIFKIRTDGDGFQVLHSFTFDARDGNNANPPIGLARRGDVLYGATSLGGENDAGTIFKMNTDGSGFQVLRNFSSRFDDGGQPQAALTLNEQTIFGTTAFGGPDGLGTLFRMNTDGSDFRLLHTFSVSEHGGAGNPSSILALDGSTLYGTTFGGGAHNWGMLYKLNTDGSGFQVLHDFDLFNANDGSWPDAGLTLSGSTLYGTTMGGGQNGQGTVFRMNTDGSGFQLLHSFGVTEYDGYRPTTSVALSGSTLFGTTNEGGAGGVGVLYAVNTDGTDYRVLHSLAQNRNDGYRLDDLTVRGSMLYGAALYGGENGFDFGAVFAFGVPETMEVTRFDEPSPSSANYSPGANGIELGFTTEQSSTGGVNRLVGVTASGGNRVLTHRSAYAVTTFDAVDLIGWTEVEVSVDMQVANTGYEAGDGVSIAVTNGVQEVLLFYQEALAGTDPLDNLAGDGFVTFTAAIPADWTSAWLVIESSSNSSTGAERFDFDNVVFSGVPVQVVPEPASWVLIVGALLSAAIGPAVARFLTIYVPASV